MSKKTCQVCDSQWCIASVEKLLRFDPVHKDTVATATRDIATTKDPFIASATLCYLQLL